MEIGGVTFVRSSFCESECEVVVGVSDGRVENGLQDDKDDSENESGM
jgi:hypothetical protein